MWPVLKAGNIVVVNTSYDLDSIKAGDLIVYSVPHKTANGATKVCHRVVSRSINILEMQPVLQCKGDNNNYFDTVIVTQKNFVGKVEYFE